MLLLGALLERLESAGLAKARGRQRTGSAHVLAAVHVLNRLGAWARRCGPLDELATVAPQRLRAVAQPAWHERCGRRAQNCRLPNLLAAERPRAGRHGV